MATNIMVIIWLLIWLKPKCRSAVKRIYRNMPPNGIGEQNRFGNYFVFWVHFEAEK